MSVGAPGWICVTCGVEQPASPSSSSEPPVRCPICEDERQYIGWDGQKLTTHWAGGDEGRDVLLSGDIFQVVMDRRWVSFMWSYPNFIPERPSVIERAVALVEDLRFDSIYGASWGRIVRGGAKDALRRSAERYLARVTRPPEA